MATLSWPAAWQPTAFEMRVVPNTRGFTSPYNGSTQVLDLGGERWSATFTLPPVNNRADGAAREALFDRLAGGINDVALWHMRHPTPRGTLTDAPVAWAITDGGSAWPVTNSGSAWPITDGTLVLRSAVAAGAQTATLQSRPGRTALAGDMLGLAGELKRVVVDATADSSGQLAITFTPRARVAWAAYSTAIVTTRPTATFQLVGTVPTQWVPGGASGASFEAIENINL